MDQCAFDTQGSYSVSNRKQAIIAATFLVFVLYNAAVAVAYIRKQTEVGITLLDPEKRNGAQEFLSSDRGGF